jgi:hypothetical protein
MAMNPRDRVHIIGFTTRGKAFYEGAAELIEHIGLGVWRVKFRDGVIERRRVMAEWQIEPRTWVRNYNIERDNNAAA